MNTDAPSPRPPAEEEAGGPRYEAFKAEQERTRKALESWTGVAHKEEPEEPKEQP